jgi:hypothetical protein
MSTVPVIIVNPQTDWGRAEALYRDLFYSRIPVLYVKLVQGPKGEQAKSKIAKTMSHCALKTIRHTANCHLIKLRPVTKPNKAYEDTQRNE